MIDFARVLGVVYVVLSIIGAMTILDRVSDWFRERRQGQAVPGETVGPAAGDSYEFDEWRVTGVYAGRPHEAIWSPVGVGHECEPWRRATGFVRMQADVSWDDGPNLYHRLVSATCGPWQPAGPLRRPAWADPDTVGDETQHNR